MEQVTELRGYPKEIANVLKCDADTAWAVFKKMGEYGFDFSLSSQRAFVKNAKLALAEIKEA